jgi:hypothetical protein
VPRLAFDAVAKARYAWIAAPLAVVLTVLPGCSQPETLHGAREPVPVPPEGEGLDFLAASEDPEQYFVIVYTAPLPSSKGERRQAVRDVHEYYVRGMPQLEWDFVAEAPPGLRTLRNRATRVFLGCSEWNRGIKEATIWVAAIPAALSSSGFSQLRLQITFSAGCEGYTGLSPEGGVGAG